MLPPKSGESKGDLLSFQELLHYIESSQKQLFFLGSRQIEFQLIWNLENIFLWYCWDKDWKINKSFIEFWVREGGTTNKKFCLIQNSDVNFGDIQKRWNRFSLFARPAETKYCWRYFQRLVPLVGVWTSTPVSLKILLICFSESSQMILARKKHGTSCHCTPSLYLFWGWCWWT